MSKLTSNAEVCAFVCYVVRRGDNSSNVKLIRALSDAYAVMRE